MYKRIHQYLSGLGCAGDSRNSGSYSVQCAWGTQAVRVGAHAVREGGGGKQCEWACKQCGWGHGGGSQIASDSS